MIDINRTFNSESGVQDIDELSGYIFSPESYAHRFLIARTDNYGYEGLITARLLRADGVTVIMTGSVNNMEEAEVILRPECYQVPGTFLLTIFHINDGEVECIYAGRGKAVQAESGMTILDAGSASSIEQQISRFIQDVGLVAVFARNVGDIEGSIATFQQSVDGILDALAEANVRALNTPNMLKQDFWETNNNETIIFGNAMRRYATGRPFVKSIKDDTHYTYDTEPQDKGDSYWVTTEEVDGQTVTTYHVYKDEDEIRISLASLATPITESDGESYNKALQFNVTAAESGMHNSEDLVFNYGSDGGTYERDGQTITYGPSGILDMVEGETYTLSCWARITSGTNARLHFSYGARYYGYVLPGAGNANDVEITNTDWERVSWSFVYHAQGQYGDLMKRVSVGVCRKYTATVQLCGFRLVHGGLYGSNTVDTLAAQVADVHANAERMDAFLDSIAPVENGSTASTNYASGALIMWNGKLYKTSAAVATGATWAVGTNLTATTLAQELAELQ